MPRRQKIRSTQRLVITALESAIQRTSTSIDTAFSRFERQHACRALRYSLVFVFFWFGITKPLAISPADQVVRPTLAHTPILSQLVSFPTFFAILGGWEALVGLGLLWRRTVRLAVACMCIQMVATFTPLFVIPTQTFRWWPFVPSAPGFYIVKNFALATAGLVVASLDSEPLFGQGRLPWLRSSGFFSNSLSRGIQKGESTRQRVIETRGLSRLSVRLLHAGLALVFIWSGILMVTVSPTPGRWIASVIPNEMVANGVVIPLLGVLELAIGLYLLVPGSRATHAAAYLAVGYIGLMMLPVAIHPLQVFVSIPFEPTFEGVYIFKDLILVTGVLTVDAYSLPRE